MELNPLAAALQGIGYASLLTALQGLWAITIIPEPLPINAIGGGLMGSIKPRRRIRRGVPFSALLPPALAIAPADEEDEALLIALGVL